MPGGRAPLASPSPTTGTSGAAGAASVGSGSEAGTDSRSAGAAGFRGRRGGVRGGLLGPGRACARGDAQPHDRRLRLGRFRRRGLGGGGSAAAGSAAGAAAVFLAPGRLAPAAMPRPTVGAAPQRGRGAVARCGFLGAGPLGARGDAEALGGGGPVGFGRAQPVRPQVLRPSWRRGASPRRPCRAPLPARLPRVLGCGRAGAFLAPGRLAPPAIQACHGCLGGLPGSHRVADGVIRRPGCRGRLAGSSRRPARPRPRRPRPSPAA